MTEEKIQPQSLKGLLHFDIELFSPVSCAWSYCPNNSVTKTQTGKTPMSQRVDFSSSLATWSQTGLISPKQTKCNIFSKNVGNVSTVDSAINCVLLELLGVKPQMCIFLQLTSYLLHFLSARPRAIAHLLTASTHSSITGSVSWERTC